MVRRLKNLYGMIKGSRPNLSILSYGCYEPDDIFKSVCKDKKLGIKRIEKYHPSTDILLVAGKLSWNNISETSEVLKDLPKKCIIIAYGSCACNKVSKADYYIPGCPPSEKTLREVLRLAQKRIKQC